MRGFSVELNHYKSLPIASWPSNDPIDENRNIIYSYRPKGFYHRKWMHQYPHIELPIYH